MHASDLTETVSESLCQDPERDVVFVPLTHEINKLLKIQFFFLH